MKCQIPSVFQHLEQIKFSLIQKFSEISPQTMYSTQDEDICEGKRPKLGSNMTGASQDMRHIWGHLKTFKNI